MTFLPVSRQLFDSACRPQLDRQLEAFFGLSPGAAGLLELEGAPRSGSGGLNAMRLQIQAKLRSARAALLEAGREISQWQTAVERGPKGRLPRRWPIQAEPPAPADGQGPRPLAGPQRPGPHVQARWRTAAGGA